MNNGQDLRKSARLGKSITGRQLHQDMKFYDEILATNDRVKSDRAVSDMMNSSRIPVIRMVSGLDQTTIQQCLFPPLRPYDGQGPKRSSPGVENHSVATMKTKDSSTVYSDTLEKEEYQRIQISKAFDWLQKARSRVDPATCYYEAAVIFNSLEMGDRAICYFLRAVEQISSVEVVDKLLLPDTEAHRRKLSRLSRIPLAAYVKERDRKRRRFIMEDEQRQFRRLQSAHIELFRLYMLNQFRDVGAAHKHLLESFRFCDSLVPDEIIAESPDLEDSTKGDVCSWRGHMDDEYRSSMYKHGAVREKPEDTKKTRAVLRTKASNKKPNSIIIKETTPEIVNNTPVRILGDGWRVRNNALRFAHNILKTYVTPDNPETPIQNHILRESAGPLAEAHIVILRELLSVNPDNAEYAQFMGMRYAEKCDFAESHRYFQLAREIEDPTPADLQTVLQQRLSRSTNTERHFSSFLSYTSKKQFKDFSCDMEKDRLKLAEMKDFSHFLGKHEGAKTIVFIPPESGWVSGVAEKSKAKECSQSSVLSTTTPLCHAIAQT